MALAISISTKGLRSMAGVHEEFSLVTHGDSRSSISALLIDFALKKSFALQHKLSDFVINMEGMSGKKYRTFINNLISSLPDARYLEIGTWAGSTACAAMYGNKARVTCVDNWSQFGGPRDEFMRNVSLCKNENIDFRFIESDFRKINYSDIGKFNVYFFDGPHSSEDQRDGLLFAMPSFDDEVIFIVDDWNAEDVRTGTSAGLNESGLNLSYMVEIRSTQDGNHPIQSQRQYSDWHNGYFIGVLSKR